MSLRQRWLMCGTRSLSPGLHAWLGPGCHFLRPYRQLLGHSKAGIAHQTWLLDRAEQERAGGTHSTGCWARAVACPAGPGRSTGEGTVCQEQCTQLTLVSPTTPDFVQPWSRTEKTTRGAARQPFTVSLPQPLRTPSGSELWVGTLSTEGRGESRLRLGWQGRWGISCLHVSLERLGQEAHLEVTHLILVTHGIQLLQLLGPVACFLFRDVCKQNVHVLGSGDPWPPSLGPWFIDVGNPRSGWRWRNRKPGALGGVVRTLKAMASPVQSPCGGAVALGLATHPGTHPKAVQSERPGEYDGRWGPWSHRSHCPP